MSNGTDSGVTMETFGKFCGLILLMFVAGAWKGLVLMKLWQWFVVPLGLIEINLWHAWGVGLAIGLTTAHKYTDDSDEERLSQIAYALVLPLIVLTVAYLLSFGVVV